MNDITDTLKIAFSLFLLMDSIGNIPVFIAILKEVNPRRQRQIILRELIIALVVIIAFNFLGDIILDLLGVTSYTVRISGAIILFLIAIKMIFPDKKNPRAHETEKEPFIVPLAIPLIAGPAVLAAVMLYSRQVNSIVIVSAIFIAWVVTTIILLCSTHIRDILGSRGILACERLMGLLLTLIAVQMFLEGWGGFLSQTAK